MASFELCLDIMHKFQEGRTTTINLQSGKGDVAIFVSL